MKHPRRKLVPPPGGWPWLAAGFTFTIGWPLGYEVPGVSPYGELKQRTHDAGALTHTASMRAGQLQDIDVGRGFIGDLRPRSVEAVAHNDRIRRSLS